MGLTINTIINQYIKLVFDTDAEYCRSEVYDKISYNLNKNSGF